MSTRTKAEQSPDLGEFACISTVQINSNGEELRSEEPHRPRIPGTARQMIRQSALALTRIVLREQMCCTRMPVIA